MSKHYFLIKLSLVMALLLMLAACGGRSSQQDNEAGVQITTAVTSTEVGETILRITLADRDGHPINDAAVSVKGDMSHAGMVPVLAQASSGQDGVYEMPFEWTMGGDWIVTVDVTLDDGRTASQQFDFTITN